MKMGKHKNSAQDVTLLKFMEEHHDIAKGFVKGDKVKMDALWKELAVDLNSNGPPQKDTHGWKKVDWTKIPNPDRPAAGHSTITSSLLKICGIYAVIEGIAATLEFGVTSAKDVTEDSTQD